MGSLGVVGFIGGHWVHSVSLGELGCALVVVGFILGCWIHSGVPCGSSG